MISRENFSEEVKEKLRNMYEEIEHLRKKFDSLYEEREKLVRKRRGVKGVEKKLWKVMKRRHELLWQADKLDTEEALKLSLE